MQLRAFQNTWHSINLDRLACGDNSKPAGPELYERFYKALDQGIGRTDEAWASNKRQTGRFVSSEVFGNWEVRTGRSPRILALCVGTCVAERVWLQEGWDVTLHECQTASLKDIRSEFPAVPVLIGDIRDLTISQRFDIIVLLTGDYFLTRSELQGFLWRVTETLAEDGLLVIHSVSILSVWQALKEMVKVASGKYRRAVWVLWGYWRTPSEFARSARQAGLCLQANYSLTFVQDCLIVKRRRSKGWPPLFSNAALMIFQQRA